MGAGDDEAAAGDDEAVRANDRLWDPRPRLAPPFGDEPVAGAVAPRQRGSLPGGGVELSVEVAGRPGEGPEAAADVLGGLVAAGFVPTADAPPVPMAGGATWIVAGALAVEGDDVEAAVAALRDRRGVVAVWR